MALIISNSSSTHLCENIPLILSGKTKHQTSKATQHAIIQTYLFNPFLKIPQQNTKIYWKSIQLGRSFREHQRWISPVLLYSLKMKCASLKKLNLTSIHCGLSEDGKAVIHSLISLSFKMSTKHTKRNKIVKVNRKESRERKFPTWRQKANWNIIDKFSNEENRSPEQTQKNKQKRWEHFFSARIAELSKKTKNWIKESFSRHMASPSKRKGFTMRVNIPEKNPACAKALWECMKHSTWRRILLLWNGRMPADENPLLKSNKLPLVSLPILRRCSQEHSLTYISKDQSLTAATQLSNQTFILKYKSINKMYSENQKHEEEGLRVGKKILTQRK